jgi:hypothetical protein
LRKQLPNYLFILPHFLLLRRLSALPDLSRLCRSAFTTGRSCSRSRTFIGLANYQALWNDKVFWEVLGNTAQFMMLDSDHQRESLAPCWWPPAKAQFLAAISCACFSMRRAFSRFRCSASSALRIWDTQLGIVNYFVTEVLGPAHFLAGQSNLVIPGTVDDNGMVDLWLPNAGLSSPVCTTFPEQLYEAAKIDGAGSLRNVPPHHVPADYADNALCRRNAVHRAHAGLCPTLHHHGRWAGQRVALGGAISV